MTVARSEIIAGEGAIVSCPHCHARVGILRKPLYQGWLFGLDAIDFYLGMAPVARLPEAVCRKCSTPYAETITERRTGRQKMLIHFEEPVGWKPHDPPPRHSPLKPAA